MKASTLLAITAALLLALGAAVSARTFGWFSPKPAVAKQDPVIKILVAKRDLFENIPISTEMLMVRDLRPEEVEAYNKNKDKYLPPRAEAGSLRTPLRNIEADQPILKTDLADLDFPNRVPGRLTPGMRGVNITVLPERAAGGLISSGDRVDVLLTSSVCDGEDCTKARTLSAFIARDLKIVAKRNSLWPVLRAQPVDQPIPFTLEANQYRAALIEFAMNKGMITLLPSSAPKGGKSASPSASAIQPVSFKDADEDDRVEKMQRGEYSITEADLERIFRLKPIIRPVPPPPPPPPIVVQNYNGLRPSGLDYFDRKTGERLAGPPAPPTPPEKKNGNGSSGPIVSGDQPLGYVFHSPEEPKGAVPGTKPGKG